MPQAPKTPVEIQPQASLNRTLVLVEPSADATSKPIKAVQLRNSNLLSRT